METLHPGLYFQEIAGISPVGGASTSTGAFVGTAPKGKIGEAVLVTNWTQFVKEFGGFDKNSYLAYAVRGFFENGGVEHTSLELYTMLKVLRAQLQLQQNYKTAVVQSLLKLKPYMMEHMETH